MHFLTMAFSLSIRFLFLLFATSIGSGQIDFIFLESSKMYAKKTLIWNKKFFVQIIVYSILCRIICTLSDNICTIVSNPPPDYIEKVAICQQREFSLLPAAEKRLGYRFPRTSLEEPKAGNGGDYDYTT